MVSQYFFDLYSNLQFNSKLQYNWKIPSWLIENKDIILKNLLPLNILTTYQIYHDIGKPYCKTYQLDDKTEVAELWRLLEKYPEQVRNLNVAYA